METPSALDAGVTWRDQYAMTKREGRWTWAMQPQYLAHMRAEMEQATIEGEKAVIALWARMVKMPMFGGVRDQVAELDAYCRRRWKARYRTRPYPLEPLKLPKLARVGVFGDVTLTHLVAVMAERQQQTDQAGMEQAAAMLAASDLTQAR